MCIIMNVSSSTARKQHRTRLQMLITSEAKKHNDDGRNTQNERWIDEAKSDRDDKDIPKSGEDKSRGEEDVLSFSFNDLVSLIWIAGDLDCPKQRWRTLSRAESIWKREEADGSILALLLTFDLHPTDCSAPASMTDALHLALLTMLMIDRMLTGFEPAAYRTRNYYIAV
ncbi:unnamed protein product [Toxocara canis]|uniref:Pecanex-like protein n=1 Tax=Toxocara canis TaxID=6265 RepID=A0A183TVM2_TOXCA|nr:unnamed protein product [Toxocara canis]